MRKIAIENNVHLIRWAESKLRDSGIRCSFGNTAAVVAVYNEDEILACVVFHDYNGANVQMSIVTTSPKWSGKDYIRRCFDFAFNCLKVEHITTFVRADNQKSLTLTKRLGFAVEGKMRRAITDYEDNVYDGVVFGMLKDECRWI